MTFQVSRCSMRAPFESPSTGEGYMADVTQQQVETALKAVIDPHLDQDLVSAKCVKNIKVDGGKAVVDIVLGYPAKGYVPELTAKLTEQVKAAGAGDVTINVTSNIVSHGVQKGVKPIEGVKNIIAVASGKGGVGKSTVAVNLALALSVEGAKVGILDADIYGPSQPRMLGVKMKPDTKDGRKMEPITSYHLQAMSIGFLVDEETPMIWRGPMVTQALEQLLRETNWQDLDYLVIDLPPGTGDVQLTLAQKVPVTGAVIVTTPQDIALLDARKGLKMFEKVEIPVLGVVENMSTHICSKCGHEEHIFGAGGGQRMADDYDVDFLGGIPLDIRIREQTDGGKPTVAAEPDGRLSQIYREIARRVAGKLSRQKKDYSGKFPGIVIQQT
jgi:ATP-binding protein involved in chromosome partitioning